MPTFSRSAKRGLFALPVALLIAAGPAFAEPQNETIITGSPGQGTVTRSMAVNYRDLDLTNGHDQHRLAKRISDAADAVCANQPDQLWNKFQGIEQSRCYNDAVAAAAARFPGAAIAAQN